MCEISLSDNLSLEELSEKLGSKITCGSNILTTECVSVKRGMGVVTNFPVSHNNNESVFGWIVIDKNKRQYKRVRFDDKKFKFRKNWKKFNGDVEITYWYYDNKTRCIKILACDCA
jgi:hypothetical protein